MQILLTLLFCSAVQAQNWFDIDPLYLTPIRVETTYRITNETIVTDFATLLTEMHHYYDNAGLYQQGVVMNSLGWLDSTTIKNVLMFVNQDAQTAFLGAAYANTDLSSRKKEFITSKQVQESGVIFGNTLQNQNVDNQWPNHVESSVSINIYQNGPLVQGWLNRRPDSGGQDGVLVINKSYQTTNITIATTHLNNLVTFLYKRGIFSGTAINWAYWMNDGGFNIHMAFDGPAAYFFYLDVLAEYPNQSEKADFDSQTTLKYTQEIGYLFDLNQINLSSEAMYTGEALLSSYGGRGLYGLQTKPREPLALHKIYTLVPIFDFTAAYYNFQAWSQTSLLWTGVFFSQASLGLAAVVFVLLAERGFPSYLIKYSRLHILFELAMLGSVYLINQREPNTENMGTIFSYVASGAGITLSALLNGADYYGVVEI